MNNYDSFYNTICRVCLKQGNKETMITLIDHTSTDGLNCHGKAVTTFSDVVISSDDDLPCALCENCLFLLKQAIYFKQKCELSDRQLKQMKELCDNSQDSFKESVCQYVMFLSYFPEELNLKRHNKNIKTKRKPTVKKSQENVDDNSQMCCDIESDGKCNYFDDDLPPNVPEHSIAVTDHDSGANDKLLDIIEKTINSDKNKRKRKYYRNIDSYYGNRQVNAYHNNTESITESQRNFFCDICQKVLANAITYDHHMQRHNGYRFICDQCGKGFAATSELNMHLVARHGNGQFYQCNHCSHKAPRKIDLIEHLRLHTGERPYTCEKCGLTFRRKAIWRKHLILHTEKNVQCTQCPKKFFTQSALADHMNNIHERRYVYVCNKCGVTYAKNKTVRDHLRLKHGIPREMQGKIERITKTPT